MTCPKIDTCPKIRIILDKEMLGFQYNEAVKRVCEACKKEELEAELKPLHTVTSLISR